MRLLSHLVDVLNNLPIAAKNAIAPVIGAVALLAAVVAAVVLLSSGVSSLQQLAEAGQLVTQSRDVRADLEAAHARLYRLTAQTTSLSSLTAGAGVDIQATIEAIKADIANAKAAALRLKTSPAMASYAEDIGGIEAKLAEYETVAAKVADLASLGSAKALAEILSADKLFDEIIGASDALAGKVEAMTAEIQRSVAQESRQARRLFLVGGLAGLAFSVFAALAISHLLTRRVRRLAAVIRGVADGDLAVEVDGNQYRDELGAISQALETFKFNARRADTLAKQNAQEQEAQLRRARQVELLTSTFENQVQDVLLALGAATEQLVQTSNEMTATASRTERESGVVASASSEAANSVLAIRDASAALAASVDEIGRHITDSLEIATKAVKEVTHSGEAMQGLSNSMGEIGAVVTLINDLAQQVNLLGLNASMEAARAGAAGRGFAVVANEVKSLARQTEEATQTIGELIARIQAETAKAVGVASQVAGTINSVNTMTNGIAVAVRDQRNTIDDISRRIEAAARSAGEVSDTIGRVARDVAQTQTAASAVDSAAAGLANQASSLRNTVRSFVANLREA